MKYVMLPNGVYGIKQELYHGYCRLVANKHGKVKRIYKNKVTPLQIGDYVIDMLLRDDWYIFVYRITGEFKEAVITEYVDGMWKTSLPNKLKEAIEYGKEQIQWETQI